ncbi:MAG: hypothetical protein DCF31_12890 [Alphaproteobacteria bacterium]|nr:MAG: hypothetical protein DCF31_12890 [Alphaproteobacteria bacterium]
MTWGKIVTFHSRHIFCGLVALLLTPNAAAASPPVSAYAHQLLLDWITLSPDGKRYAALIGDDSKYELQIIDIGTNVPLIAAAFARGSIAGVGWAGTDHLVVTRQSSDRTRQGLQRRLEVHHLDLATRSWQPLLRNTSTLAPIVSGPAMARSVAGVPMAFVNGWSVRGDEWLPTLGQINLATGFVSRAETGNKWTIEWILDSTGRAVGREDFDPATCSWKLWGRGAAPAKWRVLESSSACVDHPREGGLGRTDNQINMRKKLDDSWRLLSIDLATGDQSVAKPFDSDTAFFDPFGGQLIGYMRHTLEAETTGFFAEADQKLWRSILNAFPGEQVSYLQVSADRNVVLVGVEGQTSGLGYFAIDRAKKTAIRLADAHPGIGPGAIAEQRVVRYRAADGLEISAYLTLPRDRAARGLPLVVLNSIETFNGPGFDWMAQAVASRGYAVLQPFARGSGGLDRALLDAGNGQFTTGVETDLSDGVRYLAGTGLVDAGKVCTVGEDTKAHVALGSAAREPGLYRCAAGIMGVYDLRAYLKQWSAGPAPTREPAFLTLWKTRLGITSIDDPKLAAASPKALASRLKLPVLLIDAKNYPQGDAMEAALRAAGTPPRRVQLTGEAMWKESNAERTRVMETLVDFLEANNPPGPAPVK